MGTTARMLASMTSTISPNRGDRPIECEWAPRSSTRAIEHLLEDRLRHPRALHPMRQRHFPDALAA